MESILTSYSIRYVFLIMMMIIIIINLFLYFPSLSLFYPLFFFTWLFLCNFVLFSFHFPCILLFLSFSPFFFLHSCFFFFLFNNFLFLLLLFILFIFYIIFLSFSTFLLFVTFSCTAFLNLHYFLFSSFSLPYVVFLLLCLHHQNHHLLLQLVI